MNFRILELERILSAKRMQRYKDAANDDTRKALYRYNLRLSQEMFTIVSCFEVALRNAIDCLLVPSLGENWLKDFVQTNNHNFAPTYYKCGMLGQIVKYDKPVLAWSRFIGQLQMTAWCAGRCSKVC